jgi:hypothetical protein
MPLVSLYEYFFYQWVHDLHERKKTMAKGYNKGKIFFHFMRNNYFCSLPLKQIYTIS